MIKLLLRKNYEKITFYFPCFFICLTYELFARGCLIPLAAGDKLEGDFFFFRQWCVSQAFFLETPNAFRFPLCAILLLYFLKNKIALPAIATVAGSQSSEGRNLRYLASFVLTLGIAFLAVYRTIFSGLKRNFALFFAFWTNRFMHLPRSAKTTTTTTLIRHLTASCPRGQHRRDTDLTPGVTPTFFATLERWLSPFLFYL